MSTKTEFMEFVSKDNEARKAMEALEPEMQGKEQHARYEVLAEFAAKYGFSLTAEDFEASEMEELSEDELEAIAGGGCKNACGNLINNDAIKYIQCGYCEVLWW